MDWSKIFPIILVVVLVACCVLPMLFMGRKSGHDEKPGDKHEMK